MTEDAFKQDPVKRQSATPANEQESSGPGKEVASAGPEAQAYYTVKQIAVRWQCSIKHVRRSIESGSLPAYRLGGIMRVSADDLHRFERICRVV